MAFFRKDKDIPNCLLMSSTSIPLARGVLQSPLDATNIQIQITEGQIEPVVEAEAIQIVPQGDERPPLLGHVILRRGSRLVFEPLRKLGMEVRQNLRMPVAFNSFIYPREGGRAPIISKDLSCGGIAFYTAYSLTPGDQCQVVIPITDEGPLLLTCEVLRVLAQTQGIFLYASHFVDMINDEEALLRSAVFSIQLQSRKAQ